MSSVIATVRTYACSVCGKGFGSAYSSCAKHVSSGRVNLCRVSRAFVMPLQTIVSRHDRSVAGRQAAAGLCDYDCESDPEPGPADPASEPGYPNISQTYPNHIQMISIYIQKRYPLVSSMYPRHIHISPIEIHS